MKRLIVLAALALASCAHAPEPKIEVRTVKVPVPVSCVPSTLSTPPTYPDTDAAIKAAPGAADRYQILAAGRLLRVQRAAEVEPVIAACR